MIFAQKSLNIRSNTQGIVHLGCFFKKKEKMIVII